MMYSAASECCYLSAALMKKTLLHPGVNCAPKNNDTSVVQPIASAAADDDGDHSTYLLPSLMQLYSQSLLNLK
jgi:hypothetical protein